MIDANGQWHSKAETERLTALEEKRHHNLMETAMRKPRGIVLVLDLDADKVLAGDKMMGGYLDGAAGLAVSAAELILITESVIDRDVAPTLQSALRAACKSLQAREARELEAAAGVV